MQLRLDIHAIKKQMRCDASALRFQDSMNRERNLKPYLLAGAPTNLGRWLHDIGCLPESWKRSPQAMQSGEVTAGDDKVMVIGHGQNSRDHSITQFCAFRVCVFHVAFGLSGCPASETCVCLLRGGPCQS